MGHPLAFRIGRLRPVGEAFAQKRVALLIGNGAYRYAGQLKNPVNDVALMEQTLRGAGFDDVEVALDLGQRDLRDRPASI